MIFQVSTNFSEFTALKCRDLDPWAKDEFGWQVSLPITRRESHLTPNRTALDIVIAYPYRTQTYGTRFMVPGIQGARGKDPLSEDKLAAREKIIHWFFRWTDYCVYDTSLPLHNLIMVPPDLRRDRLEDLVALYEDHIDYAPPDDPTKPECYTNLTPLHLAVYEERHDDVRVLLNAKPKADYTKICDQDDHSHPLAIALQKVVRGSISQPGATTVKNEHKHINPRKVRCAIEMIRGTNEDQAIQKSTRLVDLCYDILGKTDKWLSEPGNGRTSYAPYVRELKRELLTCGLDSVPPADVLGWMVARFEKDEWPEFRGWDGQIYKPTPRSSTWQGPVPRPFVTAIPRQM